MRILEDVFCNMDLQAIFAWIKIAKTGRKAKWNKSWPGSLHFNVSNILPKGKYCSEGHKLFRKNYNCLIFFLFVDIRRYWIIVARVCKEPLPLWDLQILWAVVLERTFRTMREKQCHKWSPLQLNISSLTGLWETAFFPSRRFFKALGRETHSSTATDSIVRLTDVTTVFSWHLCFVWHFFLRPQRACSHHDALHACRDPNIWIPCVKWSNIWNFSVRRPDGWNGSKKGQASFLILHTELCNELSSVPV